jgi:hypothetical protein
MKIKIRDLCSPAVAALAPVAARNSPAAAAALVEVAVVVALSLQVHPLTHGVSIPQECVDTCNYNSCPYHYERYANHSD